MKCPEFEKRICLYDELTPRERNETDEHLKNCIQCTQLMERMDLMRKVVSVHRSDSPTLPNHAAMTRRIMSSVEQMQHKKRATVTQMLRTLMLAPLRYQMAIFSILLVVFFVREYTAGSAHMKVSIPYAAHPGPKTELNLASFHSAFLQTRTEKRSSSSLADCIQSCRHMSAADCKECANQFVKP